jgi:hypothetical protein
MPESLYVSLKGFSASSESSVLPPFHYTFLLSLSHYSPTERSHAVVGMTLTNFRYCASSVSPALE